MANSTTTVSPRRTLLRRALATATCLFVSACSATPQKIEQGREVALPRAFAADLAPDAPLRTDAWWREFGEARLDSLVKEALVGNRSLRAASERVAAVGALAREAGAARLPNVDASFDAARSRQNIIGVVPGQPFLTSRSTNFGLSATVSWELDLWGRLAAVDASAARRFAASEWDLEGAAQSIAASTVKAWIATVEAAAQLELAERAVTNRETARKASERRFEAGQVPAIDIELARADEYQARALVAARREERDRARRALELLLGRYPNAQIQTGAVLPAPGPTVRAGLPANLLERRPDVRAASARLDAAGHDTAAARADRYPRLALTAGGGTRSNELGDLLDGDFRVWSIGGNLLTPIFDGGRLRARVAAREAEFAAAAEDFADLVLRACGEVETLLSAERDLSDRERALIEAERAGVAAERSANDRYQNGIGDLATLLLAQRTALATQSERVTVRAARLAARVDLHLALGGTLASAPLALTETIEVERP